MGDQTNRTRPGAPASDGAGANARPKRRPLTEAERRRILERRRREAKRKKTRLVVLIAIAVLVVGAVALVLIIGGGNDAPTNGGTNNNVTTSPTDASPTGMFESVFAHARPTGTVLEGENSVSVSDLSINESLDPEWFNVLLLGVDTRIPSEGARADTMIICSINRETGDVKLSSIMRDMAVEIDGHNTQRINRTYFLGGPELVMKTINECFGMNIRNFVTVDFMSFAIIADALGGTDINITQNEMNEINSSVVETYKLAIYNGLCTDIEAEAEYNATLLTTYGENIHLTGHQTLAYARIRKLDSDYARAERQRTVLNALMSNLKDSSTAKLTGLALSCMPYLTTNMSMTEIVSIASVVLNRDDFAGAKQFRLPVPGSYKEETRNEEAMLYDTDFEHNAQKLKEFVYFAY